MGNLLSLKDGTVENITDPKDFADLVEDRLGYEAAQYMKCNFYAVDEIVTTLEDVYESLIDFAEILQAENSKIAFSDIENFVNRLISKVEKRISYFDDF